MKKYTTIYFDLDNTLLDFSAAEYNAIKQLFIMHHLPSNDEIIASYSAINQSWWERFERGEIEKEEIFAGRFKNFLELHKFSGEPEKMATDYFDLLATRHDLMDGAEEVLKYVKSRGYTVCITTNGVSMTQYRRIEASGLKPYFDYIFVSEEAGHQKPEKEYFEYVMENSPEKDREKVIVIGDSLSSDVLGGINSGFDTCWLNPKGKVTNLNVTYQIKNILEIKNIL